jgi:hypothetical protein
MTASKTGNIDIIKEILKYKPSRYLKNEVNIVVCLMIVCFTGFSFPHRFVGR